MKQSQDGRNITHQPIAATSAAANDASAYPPLRLKEGRWYHEGEVTADGCHKYCRHVDVFLPFKWYEQAHLAGTHIYVPSEEARNYVTRKAENGGRA